MSNVTEAQLSTLVERLEGRLYNLLKPAFDNMNSAIISAFDKTDVISQSAVYQKVLNSALNQIKEVAKVNNLSKAKETFGFDFSEKILKAAEETIINQLVKLESKTSKPELQEKKKIGFKKILGAIVENPIINGLIKSNPVTSTAHAVLTQVFSSKSTNINNENGRYTMPEKFKDFRNQYNEGNAVFGGNLLIEGDEETLESSIKDFNDQITPYINLFDKLSAINDKYESTLEAFLVASQKTIEKAKPVEHTFYQKLGTEIGYDREKAWNKINDFFNVGEDPSLETLEEKLADGNMNEVYKYVSEVNETALLLKNDLRKSTSILIQLNDDYITFFQELQSGNGDYPEALGKTNEINQQISKYKTQKQNLNSIISAIK